MDTARVSSRFFLGIGLGVALAAPVVSLAEITIPSDPFVGGNSISADQMNDYMNQLRTHLQAELVASDPVPDTVITETEPVVVAELQTDPINTLGGPVKIEFTPIPFGGISAGGFAEASGTAQNCVAYFDLERRTDDGDWTSVGSHMLFAAGANGNCNVRVPPNALSFIDVPVPAGAHRYRLRAWRDGGYQGIVRLKDFRMVVHELRGANP